MVREDTIGKIQFNSKIVRSGNSLYLRMPPEIIDYLDAERDTEMKVQAEHGEHGSYISCWKKNQGEE